LTSSDVPLMIGNLFVGSGGKGMRE